MANNLQYVLDTLVMPAALPVLREACVLPALVATDFDGVAKEQYETIRVSTPAEVGPADTMDVDAGSSSSDLTPGKVDIKLDQWKYKQFQMNDKEMVESVTSGVLPRAAESAIKSLANEVNAQLWGLYVDIPYFAGTAGTTPSSNAAVIGARKSLQKTLAPLGDRRLVVGVDAEAELVNLWSDVMKTGSTEALVAASMGHKFGMDIFADQQSPMHTFGTFASGSPLVNGAVSAGAQTMNVDGGSAAETLKKGDVFTVAGCKDQSGALYQFVVLANATASTGAITGLTFYPKAPTGGFADNAAITVVKPGSGTQYAINMAFHRDAFMFAARALAAEQSENSTISVAVDPVSGIPLRLETWREPGKAKRLWRFDILFGVKTLRPELAARLHG